jgi:hypothetical protein
VPHCLPSSNGYLTFVGVKQRLQGIVQATQSPIYAAATDTGELCITGPMDLPMFQRDTLPYIFLGGSC